MYVDDAFIPAKVRNGGRWVKSRWCHLFSDTSDEELHAFARRIGLRRSWAQKLDDPNRLRHHYDVTEGKRAQAVAAGAVEVDSRTAARWRTAEQSRLNAARNEQGRLL